MLGYDTINIWSPTTEIKDKELEQLKKKLFNPRMRYDRDTGEYRSTTGWLKNLQVSISEEVIAMGGRIIPAGISIRGSWPAFINGNNFETLNAEEMKNALESISYALGIHIVGFYVTRLDFALTVNLPHSVQSYLSLFGLAGRYNRCIWPGNGVLYKMQCREFEFYDKGSQMGKKRPKHTYMGDTQNLLRGELRLKKPIHRQLKIDPLSVNSLSKKDLFKTLALFWEKEYRSIRKQKSFTLLEAIRRQSDLISMLASYGALHYPGGEGGLVELLESEAASGRLSNQELKRCKAKLKEAVASESWTENYDRIRDLDQIVKSELQSCCD